ncbi:predicted protein [Chaetoceros tenuissimus]|uniref:Uncharacterized protein n=1 Tax=Chaetoceros tenuissimus TaxID=426638 RepID=A0AAD3CJ66_9STRA|nr:predicted protein [Chaetoceros tenuissimus]
MKAWRRRIKNGELGKGAGGAACRHRPRFGRQGLLTQNRKGKIDGGPNKKKKRRVVQSLSHDDAREDVDVKGYIHGDQVSCQTDKKIGGRMNFRCGDDADQIAISPIVNDRSGFDWDYTKTFIKNDARR